MARGGSRAKAPPLAARPYGPPGKIFFQKSSGLILSPGPLREASSPAGYATRKSTMYTMQVGSTMFTNLRRDRFSIVILFLIVESTYTVTPLSTVKDNDSRVLKIGRLQSGRIYQPKLIINFIGQR